MSTARSRNAGFSMPICARQWFMAHCSRSGASTISASIWSSSPARSSPSGLRTTRSLVSAQPALATMGSGSENQSWRSASAWGLFLTT